MIIEAIRAFLIRQVIKWIKRKIAKLEAKLEKEKVKLRQKTEQDEDYY